MRNSYAVALGTLPLLLIAFTSCREIAPLSGGGPEHPQRRINKTRLSNDDRLYLLANTREAGGNFTLRDKELRCGAAEGWWTVTKKDIGLAVDKITPKGSQILGLEAEPGDFIRSQHAESGHYWILWVADKWMEELVGIVSVESYVPDPDYRVAVLHVAPDQSQRLVMTPAVACESITTKVRTGPPPPQLRAETDKCALPFEVLRRCRMNCPDVPAEQSVESEVGQRICMVRDVGWILVK